jgi:hypothetical protein
MTVRKSFLSFLFLGWLIPFPGPWEVMAQVESPGRLLGNQARWDASELIYVLPPVDPWRISALKASNNTGSRKTLQFAIERTVELHPRSHGSWRTVPGYRIWKAHIISPGASSLGLVFHPFKLAPGVKLHVHDPGKQRIRGAFTSGNNKASGIFPVGHVPGDEVVVELQVPLDAGDFGELGIQSVSHALMDVGQSGVRSNCPPGQFGCSQECEIDVNCPEGDDWQMSKKAVVRIYTTSQYCTGVMLNNSAYDGQPLLLTAEHCINNDFYANRSVFLFNYESFTEYTSGFYVFRIYAVVTY